MPSDDSRHERRNREMRRRVAGGESMASVARSYNLTREMVRRIVRPSLPPPPHTVHVTMPPIVLDTLHIAAMHRTAVLLALEATGGHQADAAILLGRSVRWVRDRMREYGL